MPYIITTTQSLETDVHGATDTCTAVATLEEVRDHVHALGADYGAMAHLDCVLDGTSRMPVGPLPDGTVIEVRRTLVTPDLAREAGIPRRDWFHMSDAAILAAFNAS